MEFFVRPEAHRYRVKSTFDKLNLRPGERRLVVIVGIVVFAVLNFVFVFPNFGEYGKAMKKASETETTLRRYRMETARKGSYEAELAKLQTQGQLVAEEDQALQLQREVDSQANLAGVTILQRTPSPRGTGSRTNAFFDESSLVINFNSGEKELVDFLYNLGKGNSLVRVKSMTLGPELPNRYRLQGSLTLVESFQKKQIRPAATATSAKPATTKPAAAATTKPASKPPETKTTPPPKTTPVTNKPPSQSTTKTNQIRKPGAPAK
jgi:hypothetical protein